MSSQCFSFLSSAKICCSHDEQVLKNEQMFLFNMESFSLCKKILQLRKDSKLKYGNVELPDDVDETHGYHMKCYKKFTALSKPQIEKLNKITGGSTIMVSGKQKTDRLLRSEVTSPVPCSSDGVFEKTCLFCARLEFQVNYKKHTSNFCSTVEIEESVTHYARILNDEEMLVKIRDICFIAKEVQYHALCRSRYQMKAEYFAGQEKQHLGQYDEETPSDWHQSRETQKTFEIVCDFIDESILQNNKVQLLKDLNNLYLPALGDIGRHTETLIFHLIIYPLR